MDMAETELFLSSTYPQTSSTSSSPSFSISSMNTSVVAEVDGLTIERSVVWVIGVGFVYVLITLLTLVGNAFVIAAYVVDDKIRSRPANLLILNLAVADFCIGICIAVYFAFLLYEDWPLGEIPCKLWVALDYSCTVMSAVILMLISLDRYWMVKKKLKYRTFQTRRRISITMAVCWTLVVSFYTTMAFGYGAFTKTNHVDFSVDCYMEYLNSIPFSAASIATETIIPLVVLTYLNIVVYRNVKLRTNNKLVRSKPDRELHLPSSNMDKPCGTNVSNTSVEMGRDKLPKNADPIAIATVSITITDTKTQSNTNAQTNSYTNSLDKSAENGSAAQLSKSDQYLSASALTIDSISESRRNIQRLSDNQLARSQSVADRKKRKKNSREEHRQRRAAILLFVLVAGFLFCWSPYQIITVITTVAGEDSVPAVIVDVVAVLIWCNSLINPFLYALVSVPFRRNFIRFLGLQNAVCCYKKRPRTTQTTHDNEEREKVPTD